ncbi:MAG: FHA domain-containing protein [Halobacteriovoraceae bacterium]|nr:FHA domain-containing protein [Halobacteriovoraceae bacterium]
MYKLVAVGGKIRGEEFILKEGENIVGRDPSCDVAIPVTGISKRHISITVKGEAPIYIKDLGSSNGTFVNKKLIRETSLKNGDRLTLPDVIFQVVFVKEEKVIVKKYKEVEEDDLHDLLDGGLPPDNFVAKIKYYFKYKIMKPIYGFNEEFEYSALMGILLFIFIIVTITLTIFPVLETTKKLLEYETSQRGKQYVQEISRLNTNALEAKALDQVNTAFMKNAPGVESYELFDLEGRIVRPIAQKNKYIGDPFSVKSMEIFRNSSRKFYYEKLGDGIHGIAQRIEALNRKVNAYETVGIIAIKFAPKSLEIQAKTNSGAYLQALATSILVAMIFFGMIYYMTVRHFDEFMVQLEECMRGKRKELQSSLLWAEFLPLRNTINSLLSRNRELMAEQGDDSFVEMEPEGPYLDICSELMRGSGVATMVLNSEKLLFKINNQGEELLSFRQDDSSGQPILDICRDKGIAATLLGVAEKSENGQGTMEVDLYKMNGREYNVFCKAFIGRDSFPKAYYYTMIKDDEY